MLISSNRLSSQKQGYMKKPLTCYCMRIGQVLMQSWCRPPPPVGQWRQLSALLTTRRSGEAVPAPSLAWGGYAPTRTISWLLRVVGSEAKLHQSWLVLLGHSLLEPSFINSRGLAQTHFIEAVTVVTTYWSSFCTWLWKAFDNNLS